MAKRKLSSGARAFVLAPFLFLASLAPSAHAGDEFDRIKKEIEKECPNEVVTSLKMTGVWGVSFVEAVGGAAVTAIGSIGQGLLSLGYAPGTPRQTLSLLQIGDFWKDYGKRVGETWRDLKNPGNYLDVSVACKRAYDKLIAYKQKKDSASIRTASQPGDPDLATAKEKTFAPSPPAKISLPGAPDASRGANGA